MRTLKCWEASREKIKGGGWGRCETERGGAEAARAKEEETSEAREGVDATMPCSESGSGGDDLQAGKLAGVSIDATSRKHVIVLE